MYMMFKSILNQLTLNPDINPIIIHKLIILGHLIETKKEIWNDLLV